jgi:hypothetical protein
MTNRLMSEAALVRQFLETEGRELSGLLKDFPRGACGNASDLLGTWLLEKHLIKSEYVHGERDGKSHGWLEVGAVAIDITSDQFPDGLGAVYCGELNAFFASFKSQIRSKAAISPVLKHVYAAMKASLEKHASSEAMQPPR